jgi:hypothetical protein
MCCYSTSLTRAEKRHLAALVAILGSARFDADGEYGRDGTVCHNEFTADIAPTVTAGIAGRRIDRVAGGRDFSRATIA